MCTFSSGGELDERLFSSLDTNLDSLCYNRISYTNLDTLCYTRVFKKYYKLVQVYAIVTSTKKQKTQAHSRTPHLGQAPPLSTTSRVRT